MVRIPRLRPRSLAGQLFAVQAVLIALVVVGCAAFAYATARTQTEEAARLQAWAVARSVADSPSVVAAARGSDPSPVLQPYAERVRVDSGVDFVTIMNPAGVRWTHRDPQQIGKQFLGNTGRALQGHTFSETYTGTLGPSIRVVTPIRDGSRITGLVAAGVTVSSIGGRLGRQLAVLGWVAAGALLLGAVGTYVVNTRLRRHTHGMNSAELSGMYDYHEATLHAVREGLLMLDGRRRVSLVNDGARELLGLGDTDVQGLEVAELGLPDRLTEVLESAELRVDEVHLTGDRVLVVNVSPVTSGGRRGSVVTLRDHTELQALAGELDHERGFTQALRSQAHEAANRLHTVVSLVELGRTREAVEFATAELQLAQSLTDQVVTAMGEPVLAALLLGKTSQAHERGVELVVAPGPTAPESPGPAGGGSLTAGLPPAALPVRDLVTVLGNLVDNAVEAVVGIPGARVTVSAGTGGEPAEMVLVVADNGPGVPEGADVFRAGWSGKGPGRGLGLALVRQTVHRHGGTVTVRRSAAGGAEFTVRLPLREGAPA
ncbi:sensor histidine kinase [Streptomyces sp. NPDC089919]|uniref:sensor histidine kinase n=1 Tax=Streptomyces sp. NPDC089919 TaxID=3155188 RepID=UPI003436FF56